VCSSDLTGGTADLEGLVELGQRLLGLPVRVGVPDDIEGLDESIRGPAFATSVGILLWGLRHDSEQGRRRDRRERRPRFLDWLKELLPR
jgi:cell division protein FtsA